jgi:S1-C subfamily serine protease
MAKRRPVVRSRFDTNGIWGDLAATDAVDYRRTWIRAVSRRLFIAINLLLTVVLVTLSVIAWNLISTQPNVPEVASKAMLSMFQVECGDSAGSGFAVEMPLPSKYKTGIITAAHVVDTCAKGEKVTLRYQDRTFTGIVAKKDPDGLITNDMLDNINDVALIYCVEEFPALKPAPEPKLGDPVVVVGNPWDYTNYVTTGIISNVSVDTYMTDAAVNEGNSGGPLLDNQGRVLGFVDSRPYRPSTIQTNADINVYGDGLSVVKRLRLVCEHIFSRAAACPYN